jgi:sigma-B regulation protein RsbU (phosphoserine phosphatase)
LDEGRRFSKSIQEMRVKFQPGDLFVFYTDGFPEATNRSQEEFGEERLRKTVDKYSQGTASEIMEGVFAEMKEFTGKTKQHDDMTIVVVKTT